MSWYVSKSVTDKKVWKQVWLDLYYHDTNPLIHLNTLRPRQNGRNSADNIFCHNIFCILIKISPELVSNSTVNKMPGLVQIMAWSWAGRSVSKTFFSCLGQICSCGLSKGTFEIPQKKYMYLTHTLKSYVGYTKLKFKELLDSRALKAFWTGPHGAIPVERVAVVPKLAAWRCAPSPPVLDYDFATHPDYICNMQTQRNGSILAQVMACCLTTPSYYLNRCWLIIKGVLWHSHERKLTRIAHEFNL